MCRLPQYTPLGVVIRSSCCFEVEHVETYLSNLAMAHDDPRLFSGKRTAGSDAVRIALDGYFAKLYGTGNACPRNILHISCLSSKIL